MAFHGLLVMFCRSEEHNESLLIRVYGKNSETLIDRSQELVVNSSATFFVFSSKHTQPSFSSLNQNLHTLHSLGMCPKVYGRFANGIVYGFIPGTPFSVEDLSDPALSSKLAGTLATWHQVQIQGERKSQLFPTLRKWIATIPESYPVAAVDDKFRASFSLAEINREFRFLQEELAKLNSPVVFSHNDLLSGNIIFNRETGKISLIDYEYACYNYRGFDIGNHFCEYAGFEGDYSKYPGKEAQLRWLTSYLQGAKGVQEEVSKAELEAFYVEVNKFSLAAHFFWGVWALVQAKISDIDFDYMEYASIRFREYHSQKAKFFPAEAS